MKKIVFISGKYNVIHTGHIRLFRFAKEIGNYLVVGIHKGDERNQDYINLDDRLDILKANNLIDEIIVIDDDLVKVITKVKPKYILKGKEYEHLNNIEDNISSKIGAKLIFASGDQNYISALFEKPKFRKLNLYSNIPLNFLRKYNITPENLISILNSARKKKIAVIGDLIIDEYVYCEALGMSQEDFITTYKPVKIEAFLGGAGIVASHASAMNSEVDFYSVIGEDKNAEFVKRKLLDYKVNQFLITDPSRTTTKKVRYRNKSTVFRLTEVTSANISMDTENLIFDNFSKNIDKYDVVIISDFNYGLLTKTLINKIQNLCSKLNKFLVVDSQISSQNGDLCKYKNINLLSSTEQEIRFSLKNYDSSLNMIGFELMKSQNINNLFLKLGSDGLLIKSIKGKNNFIEKFPSLNLSPIDVSGAGDSMLVMSALGIISGGNIFESAVLGSLASGIQISRIGNIPIKFEEIINEISII